MDNFQNYIHNLDLSEEDLYDILYKLNEHIENADAYIEVLEEDELEERIKRVKVNPKERRERAKKYKKNKQKIKRAQKKYKKTAAYKKAQKKFKRKSTKPSYVKKTYY